ncbi:hypothetical protein GE107_14750 [Cohnella sp. CFH 77786]|uniref:hypothetical protein n=1 Tax=Cohnella sp. CFH 77786 TaxID=2662265 RepID=UPI001C60F5C6|nr:hypothetical protein [Cohnella sp. CFH 77786]MBW5447313.1 hypothetical protein [Cohnella sp. CFH 77786]
MLKYEFDPRILDIRESENENDAEFLIRIPDGSPGLAEMRKVQHHFEDDNDYTDVLFYLYPNHEFKVILQREHYADFLAELMKRKLLRSLEWTD